MEDAEYPAYLKKQSYEDLRSISFSIDKEGQPKRYAMVMAELAERDKSDGGKALQEDNKRAGKNLGLPVSTFFAVFFAFLGTVAICTGHIHTKYDHDIDAAKEPLLFWSDVGLYFVLAAVPLYLVITGSKK